MATKFTRGFLSAVAVGGAVSALFVASPATAVFADSSPNASCIGSISSGLGAGDGGSVTRADLSQIVLANAAAEGVPPGNIYSRHAQEHDGSFAACLS